MYRVLVLLQEAEEMGQRAAECEERGLAQLTAEQRRPESEAIRKIFRRREGFLRLGWSERSTRHVRVFLKHVIAGTRLARRRRVHGCGRRRERYTDHEPSITTLC